MSDHSQCMSELNRNTPHTLGTSVRMRCTRTHLPWISSRCVTRKPRVRGLESLAPLSASSATFVFAFSLDSKSRPAAPPPCPKFELRCPPYKSQVLANAPGLLLAPLALGLTLALLPDLKIHAARALFNLSSNDACREKIVFHGGVKGCVNPSSPRIRPVERVCPATRRASTSTLKGQRVFNANGTACSAPAP